MPDPTSTINPAVANAQPTPAQPATPTKLSPEAMREIQRSYMQKYGGMLPALKEDGSLKFTVSLGDAGTIPDPHPLAQAGVQRQAHKATRIAKPQAPGASPTGKGATCDLCGHDLEAHERYFAERNPKGQGWRDLGVSEFEQIAARMSNPATREELTAMPEAEAAALNAEL